MPPRKSNPKKKAPEKFQNLSEFSSDDDVEIKIPKIAKKDEEEQGRHPDDICQPDNADEKAKDSKTKQQDIPGGPGPKPTPSAVKSTKLKERADKELVKLAVPYWSDPKFWIPVLGIIQLYVSLEDIIISFFEFLIQPDFQLCVTVFC